MTGWAIVHKGKLVRGTLATSPREAWIAFNEQRNRWRLDWPVMLLTYKKRGYRPARVTVQLESP